MSNTVPTKLMGSAPCVYSMMFNLGGAESVHPEFLILESQFQSSLTVLGKGDEFQDLYFEV